MWSKFARTAGFSTLTTLFACSGAAPSTGGTAGAPGSSGGQAAGGGDQGSGGTSSGSGGTSSVDPQTLVWRKASLTNYESYPEPGSEECIKYNGCEWAGYFAAVNGKQTEQWVMDHNIVAMFSAGDDNAAFDTYKLKTLRLRQGTDEIDVTVYDTCGDSDCSGCCTANARESKTLIDIEKYTMARFNGRGSGVVEWACLDCDVP